MTLGQKIKQYHTEHDLSLEEFGKRVGVTRAYISQIERGGEGHRTPPRLSLDKLIMIANALGSNLAELSREVEDIDKIASVGTIPDLSREDELMIIAKNKKADTQQCGLEDKTAALGSMMMFLNGLTAEQINKLHQVGEIIF